MLVKGLDAQPIHEKVMRLLEERGVVYLHKSAPPGDGWIASDSEVPNAFSPETITLRLTALAYSQLQVESPGIPPTPYVPAGAPTERSESMDDKTTELEKLIAQAQEMVGDTGEVRLEFNYRRSFSQVRGWRAMLSTKSGVVGETIIATPTPQEALRTGIAALVQCARAQADEAQRLLHIQARLEGE